MYLSIGEWMEMNKVWSVGWGKFAAMITEKYPYKNTNLFANFEFESIGPKGKIKKIIQYELMGQLEDGTPLFNLAFGDYNKKRKNYSNLTISNNEDKNKVLATVASTTLDFSANYTRVAIHAKGSTPARTRLYQIGINTFKTEVTIYLFNQDILNKRQIYMVCLFLLRLVYCLIIDLIANFIRSIISTSNRLARVSKSLKLSC